jgi:hypothetical protein
MPDTQDDSLQSKDTWQAFPSAHLVVQAPPQSMSASVPFLIPSVQLGTVPEPLEDAVLASRTFASDAASAPLDVPLEELLDAVVPLDVLLLGVASVPRFWSTG